MSVISKTLAIEISEKLTKKYSDEIAKQELKISEYFTGIYTEQVPKLMMDCFEKHKSSMYSQIGCYVGVLGIQNRFRMTKVLPTISFSPKPKQAENLVIMINKLIDLNSDLEKLKLDIETALLGLKTYNRIKEEFPEAYDLIPIKTSKALMIDLKNIKSKI